jgi:tetratricopeptide (TPR) repeat protein
MDKISAKLRDLPKIPITCQGGVYPFPIAVQDDAGRRFQPRFPLWADSEAGAIHPGEPIAPDQEPEPVALQALFGFIEKLLHFKACPERVEVRDASLAQYLRLHLNGTGIEIVESKRLTVADRAAAEFAKMMEQMAPEMTPEMPSLLSPRGMTVERLRAFAEAAAEFYRAAPWETFSDADLIQVESPKPPKGLGFFTVLGAGRQTYGLGIYSSRKHVEQFIRAGHTGQYDASLLDGLTQFTFDPRDDLPPGDAEIWDELRLPLADRDAFPCVVKRSSDGSTNRPTAKELTYLEAVLRAFALTTEEDLDSGRWTKRVATLDGPKDVTLAAPDLLKPPSAADWIKRGYAPDPRANERMFADLNRQITSLSPRSEAELNSMMKRFVGRSIDDLATKPQSPDEIAQDFCYQAFEVHGRRKVQLARAALTIDPDCADAHTLLAEAAPLSETALEHYRLAATAAERKLGPAVFANDVGHFWGLVPTRPYMRARFGLAEMLNEFGQIAEAIEHFTDLLGLNPNDNQGARYALLPLLLESGRDQEAARLLKQYDQEDSANWHYARALLAFRLSGPSPAADRELRRALQANPHVPELIASGEMYPLPPTYSPGSFQEAVVAANELHDAFLATDGSIDWMLTVQATRDLEADRAEREKRRKRRAKEKKRKR